MAGVGFELKKLFRKDEGYVNILKSYTISAIVTEGPMVICMVLLLALRYLLVINKATITIQENLVIIITYTMIFSMILVSSFMMTISRYVSDCLYSNEINKILPSFFGISSIILVIGFILSFVTVECIPALANFNRIIIIICFNLVCLSQILTTYLSCVKQYKEILIGFLLSCIISIFLCIIFIQINVNLLNSALVSWCIGYFIANIFFFKVLLEAFPFENTQSIWDFIRSFDSYYILFFVGFFMSFGLYAHNFVVWFSQYHTTVLDTIRYCMLYDVPSFFAVLSIAPMIVTFTVSLEVNFYDKYHQYFQTILHGGRFEDIQNSYQDMVRVLYRELAYMFELQLLIAILSATIFGNILEYLGLDATMLGIFRILCFGYTFYGLLRCIVIILLYFDDRLSALKSVILFAFSSILLTALNLLLPLEYMGFGFCIAASISALYALIKLRYYLKHIDYYIFCMQPIYIETSLGIFHRLMNRLEGEKNEI